jgi:hypothetical protein
MKGLVEFKNSDGEVKLTCLFGMMAIMDFCEDKKISFNEFEESLRDNKDTIKLMKNFMTLIYFAAVNYTIYKKEEYTMTQKETFLLIDMEGLLNEENISIMTTALFSGFAKVEQKKTKVQVKQ